LFSSSPAELEVREGSVRFNDLGYTVSKLSKVVKSCVHFPLESAQGVVSLKFAQSLFHVFVNVIPLKDALVRGAGFIVMADFLCADTFHAGHFHTGVVEVEEEVVYVPDGLESGAGVIVFVTEIPYDFTDGGEVFLFDKAIVVGMVGAAFGKRDVILLTPRFNCIIDELAAAVGMDSFQTAGEALLFLWRGSF
jgi:hypothetical protein